MVIDKSLKCEVIKTEKYFEGIGLIKTYGLIVRLNNEIVKTIEDISCNSEFVCNLANKISLNDVSEIHLFDIIEDELSF